MAQGTTSPLISPHVYDAQTPAVSHKNTNKIRSKSAQELRGITKQPLRSFANLHTVVTFSLTPSKIRVHFSLP